MELELPERSVHLGHHRRQSGVGVMQSSPPESKSNVDLSNFVNFR